jgi:hypothetical protein
LQHRGLAENTLIVITSDHGESLGQHHLLHHGHALYRELIHVPLIFWYPGRLPKGIRVTSSVTNAAMPQTILDILHFNQLDSFPEPGLTDLWSQVPHRFKWPPSLSELASKKYASKADREAVELVPIAVSGPMKSLVTEQWHLILHKKYGVQLYDWRRDPGELNNLINTAEGRETATEMMSQMQDVLARSGGGSQRMESYGNLIPVTRMQSAVRTTSSAAQGDKFYRLEAQPGSTLNIQVKSEPVSEMDPVIAIENANGRPFQTCRNPGDDHIQAPGVADATPEAYDDICLNDDIDPEDNTNSQLEIRVPQNVGSPVELHVRVSDWNGRVGPGLTYQIQVSPVP